jgi:hypothetical protein
MQDFQFNPSLQAGDQTQNHQPGFSPNRRRGMALRTIRAEARCIWLIKIPSLKAGVTECFLEKKSILNRTAGVLTDWYF